MKNRETNFKTDVKIYGPIGENDLIEKIKSSKKALRVENITTDSRFFQWDIDIVQYKKDTVNRETIFDDLSNNKEHNLDDYILYEVKTDTYGLTTRNIDYEFYDCRNRKIGCAARSKCDYFYYVFVDKENNIKERYLIKMSHLRQYIDTNRDNLRIHHMVKTSGDRTDNYLINIDELVRLKIANKLI